MTKFTLLFIIRDLKVGCEPNMTECVILMIANDYIRNNFGERSSSAVDCLTR